MIYNFRFYRAEASKILDSFPANKLKEIIWVNPLQDVNLFEKQLKILISDLLTGRLNSLFNSPEYTKLKK